MAQQGYTIQPLKEEDVDKVMDLLQRTFYIDEPMNQAIGLYSDGNCPELEDYCKSSMLEGLSFTAVDAEGNIVGALISGVCPLKQDENGHDYLSLAEKCQNPKFKKILYVLAQREEGARLWEKYPEETKLVEVKVAATDPKWRRKGIMNKLVEETEKLVKQRGIKLLRMDTSSAYSALSAERLGFTLMYSAAYVDIKLDGRPLIVPAHPHDYDRVYIKVLL